MCTVADFTGTMRGPMKASDGKLIAPTNKKFHIEFCTVAHWKNGEIIEEKLFYDLVELLKWNRERCLQFVFLAEGFCAAGLGAHRQQCYVVAL